MWNPSRQTTLFKNISGNLIIKFYHIQFYRLLELQGLRWIDSLLSRKLSACVPGKFHFVLGRLYSFSGEAPKLRPCSHLQIGLCYHALGVILYIYTTENLSIFPKTTMLFDSP